MAWTNPKSWSAGETLTAANFNMHIRDNLNAVGPVQKIRKSADESVTSNITPQNDDHLSFAVAANEVWAITMRLSYANNNTGNCLLNVDHTIPSGATGFYSVRYKTSTGMWANDDVAWTTAVSGLGVQQTADQPVWIDGTLINSTSAGTFQFQWAQTTSHANATVVRTGSWLWAVRLSP